MPQIEVVPRGPLMRVAVPVGVKKQEKPLVSVTPVVPAMVSIV